MEKTASWAVTGDTIPGHRELTPKYISHPNFCRSLFGHPASSCFALIATSFQNEWISQWINIIPGLNWTIKNTHEGTKSKEKAKCRMYGIAHMMEDWQCYTISSHLVLYKLVCQRQCLKGTFKISQRKHLNKKPLLTTGPLNLTVAIAKKKHCDPL